MYKIFIALLFSFSSQAHAFCFKEASQRYGVSEAILMAIAKTESGFNSNATNINKNGTKDIGLMQINSAHLGELSKYGITERMLYDNPCANVNIGAWILARSIAYHGNNWRAVGSYNTGIKGAESKRAVYANKVAQNLKKITNGN